MTLIVIAVAVLAACGTTAPPTASEPAASGGTPATTTDEPIRLQFMGWGGPSEQEVFKTLIDKYQQDHPGVVVDYILVPPGEFLQKLTTLAAADELPDVFYMGSDWFSAWVTKGIMLPVEDHISASELERIWPRALDLYRYDGSTVGTGKIYALPKDLGPWVMVYNKDLFDKHGVAYPPSDGSWSWDEALAAWQKMTVQKPDGTYESYGVGDYSLEAAVWSNGADFLNADRTRVTVDDPKFAEALQFVRDLSCVHQVSPSQTDRASLNTYEMWTKGMLGTHVMGPWDQPAFWELPFNWDIAPFPSSPATGTPASWTGSMGFGVSAKTAHPKEAVDLARYFSIDEDGQKTNYELGQAVPNLVDMAKGEFLEMPKAPASRQIFLDNIETWGRPTLGWYTSNDQWIDTMWQEMAPVWSCERDAADWGAEWAPKLTETLTREPQVPAMLP
jgi:multiple sugar transport system substrate-binding protein